MTDLEAITLQVVIKSYNEAHGTTIVIRQVKYLNNIVEQDHSRQAGDPADATVMQLKILGF